MIEGIGRMQPITPATAETTGRSTDTGSLRSVAAAGSMPFTDAPADVSLQRMGAAMAAEPPVDAGKVAALRMAIENGSYSADPAAIADAILRQGGA